MLICYNICSFIHLSEISSDVFTFIFNHFADTFIQSDLLIYWIYSLSIYAGYVIVR